MQKADKENYNDDYILSPIQTNCLALGQGFTREITEKSERIYEELQMFWKRKAKCEKFLSFLLLIFNFLVFQF